MKTPYIVTTKAVEFRKPSTASLSATCSPALPVGWTSYMTTPIMKTARYSKKPRNLRRTPKAVAT